MLKCIRYSLFVISITVFALGFLLSNFNIVLIGLIILFFSNVSYAFEKLRSRIFFLFFNIVVAVFLMGRPIVGLINKTKWWTFSNQSICFALVSIFLTLIFLFVGAQIAEIVISKKKALSNDTLSAKRLSSSSFNQSLQIISLLLFYFVITCCFIVEMERLIYMHNRPYIELYTTFRSKLPYIMEVLSDMVPYALCIYLSTLPNKKAAFVPLTLYILSAVPDLLIGLRNPIVLNCIFVFLYYFIRDSLGDVKKWIGKVEKTIIIVALPLFLAFLSAYNYIRDDVKVAKSSFTSLILDLLYHQGVTFDVLCIGYNSIPLLPTGRFRNYTFGGIIDYFKHGTLSQIFFHADPLPPGNNLYMALKSNSFAHNMSYVAKGQEYLDGHGWGSSYILETYADFGYVGIILFSILLGFLLVYALYLMKKNWFACTIVLISLTSIFFSPRAEATGFIIFIVTAQFLLPTIFCYFLAKLCQKQYSFSLECKSHSGSPLLSQNCRNNV